jgi:hypothetical protein
LNWFKSAVAVRPQNRRSTAGQALCPAATPEPGDAMSDFDQTNEPVPLMQQLLDNPFLLLFIGVLVPMLVYTLWGVIDILTVPLTK